jgi:hypothetical protein
MDLNEAAIELHRQAIQLSLTCPISRGIYNDPVLIQQSGHVVDRKSLCEWLLQNPTRCPVTNVDFGKKLQYCDCHFSKSRLILYEENEYKRYDDSEFQRQYEALQIVPRESKEKKLGARETKSVDHFDQDSHVDPLYYLPKCTVGGPEEAFRLGDGNSYSVDSFTCLDENPVSLSDEGLKKIPLSFQGDPFTTTSTEINSPNSFSRPPNVSYQRENLIIQKPKVNDSRAIYDTHVSESMDAKDGGMISTSAPSVLRDSSKPPPSKKKGKKETKAMKAGSSPKKPKLPKAKAKAGSKSPHGIDSTLQTAPPSPRFYVKGGRSYVDVDEVHMGEGGDIIIDGKGKTDNPYLCEIISTYDPNAIKDGKVARKISREIVSEKTKGRRFLVPCKQKPPSHAKNDEKEAVERYDLPKKVAAVKMILKILRDTHRTYIREDEIVDDDVKFGNEFKDDTHAGNEYLRSGTQEYADKFKEYGNKNGKKRDLAAKVAKDYVKGRGLKAVPGKSNRFGILHDDEVRDYVSRRLQDHAEETKKKRKEREEKKKNEEQERMEETKEEQDSDNFDDVSEGIAAIPAWMTFGEGEEGDDHETSLKQNKKQKRS